MVQCPNSANSSLAEAGNMLAGAGRWLSDFGNQTAQVGADLALVGAGASLVGIPAEPLIAVGAAGATVGTGISVLGSTAQFLGGAMSGNGNVAGMGYVTGALSLVEGALFDMTTSEFGLPGLPTGLTDPVDVVADSLFPESEGVAICP
jgi:hypothetical protein